MTVRRSRVLRALLALGLVAQAAACASLPRTPYTAAQAAVASVPGIPDARVYSDASVETVTALAARPEARRGFTYLALSGGGGDGAYGAGILNGWTASGTRPSPSWGRPTTPI